MTGENELENINENAAPLEGAEGAAGSSGAEGTDVHPIYEVPKPEEPEWRGGVPEGPVGNVMAGRITTFPCTGEIEL